MVTARQLTSNRTNAQKSTGPASAAGKRQSSKNSLRHGLNSKAPDPAQSAAVGELAAALCAEDAELALDLALRIAEALVRADTVTRVAEELILTALQEQDGALCYERREELATLAVLDRLAPLYEHQKRTAGTLRRALRRI